MLGVWAVFAIGQVVESYVVVWRTCGRLVVPTVPDVVMEDGFRPNIPGWNLRAIWTPGHTPGHMCFVEEDRRVLRGAVPAARYGRRRAGYGQHRADDHADEHRDAGDDHPPRRGCDHLDRLHERIAKPPLDSGDGLRLHAKHLASTLEDVGGH